MEKFEIIKQLYQNVEMSHYSTNKLLKNLEEKDNKIKGLIEDILKDYEAWMDKAVEFLKTHNQKLEKKKITDKMMASMGIKKEIKNDNSDSSMADLLIQGIVMGSNELEKQINTFKDVSSKDELEFVKEYQDFEKETIKRLKKYL